MELFSFYIPEWFFVALNLVILMAILRLVLWKRVGRILDERQARVQKTMEDSQEAQRLRMEAEANRAQLEHEMEIKSAQLMNEVRIRAGKEYDRIVSEAETKAEQILAHAQQQARQENERMKLEFKKQMAAVSMEAAGLLLRSNVNSEANQRLVESYINDWEQTA